MIHQNLDGHESGTPTRHLSVEKKHGVMLIDVLRQLQVMQFGFTGSHVRLDKDAASSAVGDDSPQASLKRRAASQHNHCAHLTLPGQTLIVMSLRCLNDMFFELCIIESAVSASQHTDLE